MRQRFLFGVLGAVLLLAGVATLVLPKQGLLAMETGLCLMDFPGKRKALGWTVEKMVIQ